LSRVLPPVFTTYQSGSTLCSFTESHFSLPCKFYRIVACSNEWNSRTIFYKQVHPCLTLRKMPDIFKHSWNVH
jgi:hypothetical protein